MQEQPQNIIADISVHFSPFSLPIPRISKGQNLKALVQNQINIAPKFQTLKYNNQQILDSDSIDVSPAAKIGYIVEINTEKYLIENKMHESFKIYINSLLDACGDALIEMPQEKPSKLINFF